MYGLNRDERKVVDDFLVRYSSGTALMVAETESEPDEEAP
jgi:hypothetical protein